MEFARKSGMEERLPFIYNKLGKCKYMMLDYAEAIRYYKISSELAQKYGDGASYKNTFMNLSLAYSNFEQYEDALKNIELFMSLCEIEKNFNEYANAIIIKANCFLEQQQYHKAIDCYKSIINYDCIHRSPVGGYIYNNLGLINICMSDHKQAYLFLDKSEEIRRVYDLPKLCSTLLNKAELLVRELMFEAAEQVANEAVRLSKQYNDKLSEIKGFILLEKVYIATDYQEKLNNVYESLGILLKDSKDKEQILSRYYFQ